MVTIAAAVTVVVLSAIDNFRLVDDEGDAGADNFADLFDVFDVFEAFAVAFAFDFDFEDGVNPDFDFELFFFVDDDNFGLEFDFE